MNQNSILVRFLLALSILLPAAAATGQTSASEKQIDQIFSQWNNRTTPGASVAVIQNGSIVFKKGYGSANLEYNIPVNPSTVFQIASVSKQVTAFAVLLLESRGKLSLDDDVRKFIPEMPDFGKVITLRHLLFHTSGLREYWELLSMAGWRYDDVITREQVLKLIYRQKGLNFVPGSEHVYTNTGYLILAEVVSRVSGETFATFTRDNIFKPLKMNSTLFMDDREMIVPNLAQSYYLSADGYKKSLLNHSNTGSTNLLTSVEDMSKWIKNFEKPVIGDIRLIQKMDERGTLVTGDTIAYAPGQEVGPYKGLTLIGHRGAEAGYRSFLGRFPEQHFSIMVFSNNASIDPTDAGLKIADIYLKNNFVVEKSETKATPVQPAVKEYSGDISVLKKCVGEYELRPGYIISITSENNRLFAEGHEVPKSQLIRTSESEFLLPLMRASLTFAGDNESGINKLIVVLNGQQMVAPKIKAFDTTTVNPDEYTGDFYSPELGTVYAFASSDKQLVAKHSRLDDFPLTAVNRDQFSSDKRFCTRIEFIRNENNVITGCMITGGRVRNIHFEKIRHL